MAAPAAAAADGGAPSTAFFFIARSCASISLTIVSRSYAGSHPTSLRNTLSSREYGTDSAIACRLSAGSGPLYVSWKLGSCCWRAVARSDGEKTTACTLYLPAANNLDFQTCTYARDRNVRESQYKSEQRRVAYRRSRSRIIQSELGGYAVRTLMRWLGASISAMVAPTQSSMYLLRPIMHPPSSIYIYVYI